MELEQNLKLKLKIAWVKGWNETTRHPVPCQKVIDLSLITSEDEETAYRQGVGFARMVEDDPSLVDCLGE